MDQGYVKIQKSGRRQQDEALMNTLSEWATGKRKMSVKTQQNITHKEGDAAVKTSDEASEKIKWENFQSRKVRI